MAAQCLLWYFFIILFCYCWSLKSIEVLACHLVDKYKIVQMHIIILKKNICINLDPKYFLQRKCPKTSKSLHTGFKSLFNNTSKDFQPKHTLPFIKHWVKITTDCIISYMKNDLQNKTDSSILFRIHCSMSYTVHDIPSSSCFDSTLLFYIRNILQYYCRSVAGSCLIQFWI